jgi:hypothetical protein
LSQPRYLPNSHRQDLLNIGFDKKPEEQAQPTSRPNSDIDPILNPGHAVQPQDDQGREHRHSSSHSESKPIVQSPDQFGDEFPMEKRISILNKLLSAPISHGAFLRDLNTCLRPGLAEKEVHGDNAEVSHQVDGPRLQQA